MSQITPPMRSPTSASVFWQLDIAATHSMAALSVGISSARFRVGRRAEAELVLPAPQISGFHAEFSILGLRLFVRDLASTNGTYVNGKRIGYHDVPLRDGDRLRMANVEFVVRRHRGLPPEADTAVLTHVESGSHNDVGTRPDSHQANSG